MEFCSECGAKNKDDSKFCKFVKADKALLNRDIFLFKKKYFSFYTFNILDLNTNEVLFLVRWRWMKFVICDKDKNPILELKQKFKLGMAEYDVLEGQHKIATFKCRFRWAGFEFDILKDDKIIADVIMEPWSRRFFKAFSPLSKIYYYFRWAQQNVIGNMNRKSWSFMPKYELDLRDDPGKKLDRKIVLAAGVVIANRMYQRTHSND